MSLTPTQRRNALDIQDGLKSRGIIFINGRNDGKTRIFSRVIENKFTPEGPRVAMQQRARHPEDQDIVFVIDAVFPRADKITITGMKRQILAAFGMSSMRMACHVETAFRELLVDHAKANKMICIAYDNAELIAAKGFTVLKHLNEIRYDHKDVGVAILLSGEQSRMKMPFAFYKRTVEIEVGRFNAATDILALIDAKWPGMSGHFTPEALSAVQAHGTTLEMEAAARKAIRKMRSLRQDTVTRETVELPSFAKAA
jgi:hypothetical protein